MNINLGLLLIQEEEVQNKSEKYLEGRNKESSESQLIDGSIQSLVDNVEKNENGLEQKKVSVIIE